MHHANALGPRSYADPYSGDMPSPKDATKAAEEAEKAAREAEQAKAKAEAEQRARKVKEVEDARKAAAAARETKRKAEGGMVERPTRQEAGFLIAFVNVQVVLFAVGSVLLWWALFVSFVYGEKLAPLSDSQERRLSFANVIFVVFGLFLWLSVFLCVLPCTFFGTLKDMKEKSRLWGPKQQADEAAIGREVLFIPLIPVWLWAALTFASEGYGGFMAIVGWGTIMTYAAFCLQRTVAADPKDKRVDDYKWRLGTLKWLRIPAIFMVVLSAALLAFEGLVSNQWREEGPVGLEFLAFHVGAFVGWCILWVLFVAVGIDTNRFLRTYDRKYRPERLRRNEGGKPTNKLANLHFCGALAGFIAGFVRAAGSWVAADVIGLIGSVVMLASLGQLEK